MSSIYQWQSNDVLSVYASDGAQVYTGYKNLETPSWAKFEFAERFGLSLLKRGDILTPLDIAEKNAGRLLNKSVYAPKIDSYGNIVYGLLGNTPRSAVETSENSTIRALGIVAVWPEVFKAVNDIRTLIYYMSEVFFKYFEYEAPRGAALTTSKYDEIRGLFLGGAGGQEFGRLPPWAQKHILLSAQLYAEHQIESFDEMFIPKLERFLESSMSKEDTPVMRRYGMSVNFGILENTMQYQVNALTSISSRNVNPDVFSRRGDGSVADPTMDLVTLAFAGVIVNPQRTGPRQGLTNLVPSHNSETIEEMNRQGAAPYFPRLNYYPVPSDYGISEIAALTRRSLLMLIHGLCENLPIAQSFGTKRAISEIYKFSNDDIRRLIINAVFPFTGTPGELMTGGRIRAHNLGGTWKYRALDGSQVEVRGRDFFATLYLMDLLNSSGSRALRRHTVNYLTWVKHKCLQSVSLSQISRYVKTAISPSMLALTQAGRMSQIANTLVRSPSSTLRNLVPSDSTSGQTPTSFIRIPKPSDSTSGQTPSPSDSTSDQTPSEDVDAAVSKQVSDSNADAAKTPTSTYIYAISAVVILGSVATVAIVRNRRKGL